MADVIELRTRRVLPTAKHDRETKSLLSNLASLADLDEGGSAVVIYRRPNGEERFALTGIYQADPSKALKALMQIVLTLTKDDDRGRGRPCQ